MMRKSFTNAFWLNEDVPDEPPGTRQYCQDGLKKFDERFHLVLAGSGLPATHMHYRISAASGEVFEGITDSQGFTERVKTEFATNLEIEILDFEHETWGDHD